MGRATKLNEKMIVELTETYSHGASIVACARRSLIAPHSLMDWRKFGQEASDYYQKTGREKKPVKKYALCRKLFESMEKGRHDLQLTLLAQIRLAIKESPKNWVAAMTLLERIFPDDFCRKSIVRHDNTTVSEGKSIQSFNGTTRWFLDALGELSEKLIRNPDASLRNDLRAVASAGIAAKNLKDLSEIEEKVNQIEEFDKQVNKQENSGLRIIKTN